ncbi:MAG: hypothetical protein IID37_06785 [Planctomycetes bacterium]|nr:hypothetical protein [Planctomycetota bacterium]
MMNTIRCACGTEYPLTERLYGKRVRCKMCGVEFTAPDPNSPELHASPPAGESSVGQYSGEVFDDDRGPSLTAFWADCLRSLLFLRSVSSLITFSFLAIIAAVQVFLPFGGCLGQIARVIVAGWILGFLFHVIQEAASGESELPSFSLSEGWFEDVVVPLVKFLISWLVVGWPALLYAMLDIQYSVSGRLNLPFNPAVVLLGLGVFAWPMVILTTAVGGLSGLWRVDLMISTVLRSFVGYATTAAATVVAYAAFQLAEALLQSRSHTDPSSVVAMAAGLEVLAVYAAIVAMRIIGLYYHHFKDDFAWSWD